MVWVKPTSVNINYVNLPKDICERHKNVILSADIMFVNSIPFFITVSRHIKFTTVEPLDDRSDKTILAAIRNVVKLYKQRNFNVTVILADPEFNSLNTELQNNNILLNTTAMQEHTPEVKRQIRVIKEQVRAAWSTLPY